MMIGTMHVEEARVFDSYAGTHKFHAGGIAEVFWHNGGHMDADGNPMEQPEDDDMPLDDWRDAERPGWYFKYSHDNPVDTELHGPYATSRQAMEEAVGDYGYEN